jgi:hypothetical protein
LLLTTARGARVAVAANILAVGVAAAPAPVPALQGISLDATTVEGVAEVQVTVALDLPAPDAGLTVALESDRPDVAAVPPSVTVARGRTVAGFRISVQEVATSTAVALRASLGSDVVQAVLNVEAPEPSLAGFTIAAATVTAGEEIEGTVQIDRPAPSPGTVVDLAVTPAPVSSSPSVTVAAGQTEASFSIATTEVLETTELTVTVTLGSDSRPLTVMVEVPQPALVGFAVAAGTVTAGEQIEGTIQLDRPAPAGGTVVELAAMPAETVSLGPSVTVPPGQTEASFQILTGDAPATTQVTLNATLRSDTRSATVTVEAPPAALSALELSASSVEAGGMVVLTVTLDGPAAADTEIALSASYGAGAVVLPPTVILPAGGSAVSIEVATKTNYPALTVTLRAELGGIVREADLTVAAPPRPVLVGLSLERSTAEPTVAAGVEIEGSVQLDRPAPAGGVAVGLSSSKPDVPLSNTLWVPAGSTEASFWVTVAPGVSGGTATISATLEGVSLQEFLSVVAPPPFQVTVNVGAFRLTVLPPGGGN